MGQVQTNAVTSMYVYVSGPGRTLDFLFPICSYAVDCHIVIYRSVGNTWADSVA